MTYLQKKAKCSIHKKRHFTINAPAWRVWCAAFIACAISIAGVAQTALTQETDDSGEWRVRLIVETDDGRRDRSNLLGRLKESSLDKDRNDLPEMPPPPSPMGDNYLSIVFPHPDWKPEIPGMPDYTVDFHGVPDGPDTDDTWNFEVRTHTPGIEAKLRWEGPKAVLERSRIKDAATGKVLVENCAAVAGYFFLLKKEGVPFIWEYQAQAVTDTTANSK